MLLKDCLLVLVVFWGPSCCYQFSPDLFSAAFVADVNAVADTWVADHNFPVNMTKEQLGYLLDLSEPTSDHKKYLDETISREGVSNAATGYKPFAKTITREGVSATATGYKYFDKTIAEKGISAAAIDYKSLAESNGITRKLQSVGEDSKIPASFDARTNWPNCPNIGKVYDQGACPSSYAFAVVPAFSDRRCIHSNGAHPEPLSIEYLLSCCHACKLKDDTRVCGAGQAITAWWFLHKRGIVTGGAYRSKEGCQPVSFPPCNRVFSETGSFCTDQTAPSLRCHTRCTNENYTVPYSRDRHRGKIQYWVNTQVTAIQREILTNGPATTQISVYEDFLHYKSGVYRHVTKGKRFPHQHTLKLIGWGEEAGIPYWLLLNSWGAHWGDQGTVKILRGHAECYIEYYVSASIPKY